MPQAIKRGMNWRQKYILVRVVPIHFDPKIASEKILEHPILNISQGKHAPRSPLIAAAWLQSYACLNLKCLLLPMFKVIVLLNYRREAVPTILVVI